MLFHLIVLGDLHIDPTCHGMRENNGYECCRFKKWEKRHKKFGNICRNTGYFCGEYKYETGLDVGKLCEFFNG